MRGTLIFNNCLSLSPSKCIMPTSCKHTLDNCDQWFLNLASLCQFVIPKIIGIECISDFPCVSIDEITTKPLEIIEIGWDCQIRYEYVRIATKFCIMTYMWLRHFNDHRQSSSLETLEKQKSLTGIHQIHKKWKPSILSFFWKVCKRWKYENAKLIWEQQLMTLAMALALVRENKCGM